MLNNKNVGVFPVGKFDAPARSLFFQFSSVEAMYILSLLLSKQCISN